MDWTKELLYLIERVEKVQPQGQNIAKRLFFHAQAMEKILHEQISKAK